MLLDLTPRYHPAGELRPAAELALFASFADDGFGIAGMVSSWSHMRNRYSVEEMDEIGTFYIYRAGLTITGPVSVAGISCRVAVLISLTSPFGALTSGGLYICLLHLVVPRFKGQMPSLVDCFNILPAVIVLVNLARLAFIEKVSEMRLRFGVSGQP